MKANTEIPKRLAPTGETLRELFLKSGNLCAFPGCPHLMMNADGVFVGQICHIEAAEAGGQRFNPKSTNQGRRQVENLMLMCHAHHKITDDVKTYTVDKLKEMKRKHEARFSSPERAIMEQLKDWTKSAEPTLPKNLNRLQRVLKQQLDEEDRDRQVAELRKYVTRLKKVPIEVREFLRAVAQRTYDMRHENVVVSYGASTGIRTSDLKGALKRSDNAIAKRTRELNSYGLGDIIEIEDENFRKDYGVRLESLESGWELWMDLARFCERASIGLDSFAIDLDFAQLDE